MTSVPAHRRPRVPLAVWLVLPLVLYLASVFFAPLASMLTLAVDDRDLAAVMPRTVQVLDGWPAQGVPPPDAFEAVARDLAQARLDRSVGQAARRINLERPGLRSVLTVTARRLPQPLPANASPAEWKALLVEAAPEWQEPEVWQALARSGGPLTDLYLLAAVDLKRDARGDLTQVPIDQALYVDVLLRTLGIALSATLICLVLALPTAHWLATASPRASAWLMLALLLPLWTSVLVRSASWLVLLQSNGLVNQLLQALRVIDEPLQLVFNRTGVLVSLCHVLLPYAVLPVCNAMKAVPSTQLRAASSLGAGPLRSFWRIYLPQIVPGLSAAGMLTFILALGYYITPLLLGGASDQLLPFFIAQNAIETVNWGLAAALGSVLLVVTLLLYALYARLVGADRIGMG